MSSCLRNISLAFSLIGITLSPVLEYLPLAEHSCQLAHAKFLGLSFSEYRKIQLKTSAETLYRKSQENRNQTQRFIVLCRENT